MRFSFIVILTVCSFIMPSIASAYQADLVLLNVVTGSKTADTVAIDCVEEIRQLLDATGRFFPESRAKTMQMFSDGQFNDSKMLETAGKSGIRRFWTVTVVQDASKIHALVEMIELSGETIKRREIRISSGIVQNLSLLAAREVAKVISHTEITAKVLSIGDNGRCIVEAGQWHGIIEGQRYATSEGSAVAEQTGRFVSTLILGKKPSSDTIVIHLDPDIDQYADALNQHIRKNIVRTHGIENVLLTQGEPAEKKLFTSTLVINSGASLVLPGYGSYLSVYYMGFQNPKPSYAGMFAGAGTECIQLLAVPVMTGFKANFFPWTDDHSRTHSQKSLQIFLWSTIPLTWASTYFDQLAVSYESGKILPPLFDHADESAAVSSLLLPGGGLFYKGHRGAGWGYFASEIGVGSYVAYNWRSRKGKNAAMLLCAIKGIEIINAYFIRPSYSFYNREFEGEGRANIELSFRPDGKNIAPALAAVLTF